MSLQASSKQDIQARVLAILVREFDVDAAEISAADRPRDRPRFRQPRRRRAGGLDRGGHRARVLRRRHRADADDRRDRRARAPARLDRRARLRSSGAVSEIAAAPEFISLAELLRRGANPRAPVAFARDGERDWADFAARVGVARRPRSPRGASARLLLFSEDSYAFAVGLFAVAHAGARALVAPNRQPQTLVGAGRAGRRRARRPGDRRGRARAACRGSIRWASAGPQARPLRARSIRIGRWSSSRPRARPARARRCRRRCATWISSSPCRRRCSARGSAARACSRPCRTSTCTASCSACSGRSRRGARSAPRRSCTPRSSSRACARRGEFALATTPVHLRRMRADAELRGAARRAAARSSRRAGRSTTTWRATSPARVGHAPLEIFGSSETGGVAWRAQTLAGPSARWQPFPGSRALGRARTRAGSWCARRS